MRQPAWASRVARAQPQSGLNRLAPLLVAVHQYEANPFLAIGNIAVRIDKRSFIAFADRPFEIAFGKDRLCYPSTSSAVVWIKPNSFAGKRLSFDDGSTRSTVELTIRLQIAFVASRNSRVI